MDTRDVAGILVVATAIAGCLGPELTFAGAGGGGGDAATTTTVGGGGDAATATTVGGGGDAATTSTGGGPECGECSGTETCDEALGVCVPRCENGEQDGDETDVDCGGSCEASCSAGQGCIDGTDCESNVCEPSSSCASGKLVFVTADWLRPDFGGALAGDAICQQTAEGAGFSGTFMAWLSDGTTSPSARFTPSAEPYRMVDGTVVAGDWAQLTSGFLLAGIDLDEQGGVNPYAEVWTATNVDGTLIGPTCLEWTTQEIEPTGFAGRATETDERWTVVYTQFCNRSGLRLYCFQQ